MFSGAGGDGVFSRHTPISRVTDYLSTTDWADLLRRGGRCSPVSRQVDLAAARHADAHASCRLKCIPCECQVAGPHHRPVRMC